MIQSKKFFVYAGFIWCFLFALLSFYWASGGMIGIRSLGGLIYQKALEREASFIAFVWLTAFVKLCGCLNYFLYPKFGISLHRLVKYLTTIFGSLALVKIPFLFP